MLCAPASMMWSWTSDRKAERAQRSRRRRSAARCAGRCTAAWDFKSWLIDREVVRRDHLSKRPSSWQARSLRAGKTGRSRTETGARALATARGNGRHALERQRAGNRGRSTGSYGKARLSGPAGSHSSPWAASATLRWIRSRFERRLQIILESLQQVAGPGHVSPLGSHGVDQIAPLRDDPLAVGNLPIGILQVLTVVMMERGCLPSQGRRARWTASHEHGDHKAALSTPASASSSAMWSRA